MFWNIIIGVASFLLQLLLTPKPQNAKPAALEDFDVPVAQEGREIPVISGTEFVRVPNVTWVGDLGIEEVKGPRRYGFFGPRSVIGHKYSLGMQMVLCHGPADKITEIWVGDKLAWSGETTGGRISIDKPELFGGDEREGGIVGDVDVCMGAPTQPQNDYLAQDHVLGADVSAFRGVVTIVLRQVYLGNNTYIKPWAFKIQRIYLLSDGTEQWYSSKAGIPRSGTGVREKRVVSNVGGPTLNSHRMYDASGTTLVHFNSTNTQLIIEDIRTGTIRATIAVTWTTVFVYISPSTGDVIVTDTLGFMRVYSGTNGTLKQTVTGWGDPTPPGDGFAQLDGTPTEIVISDVTYMFFMVTFEVVAFANDGSSWAFLWSDRDWSSLGRMNGVIAAGPTYLAIRMAFGGVYRTNWDVTGLSGTITVDVASFGWSAISIHTVSYTGTSDRYILTGTDGQVLVLNNDLTTLVAFGDAGGWGSPLASGASTLVSPVLARRIMDGSDSVVFFKQAATHDYIYFYNVSTATQSSAIGLSEWGIDSPGETGFSDSAFSEEERAIVLFNAGPPAKITILFLPRDLDMNPAHIIREYLTDMFWAMGYNTSDITDDIFTAAADWLYSEGFGLTINWAQEEKIEEMITIILSHIDAYLFTSIVTGKFILKLIRKDYVLGDLPVITEDELVSIDEIERRQPPDTTTTVTVEYADRWQNQGRLATVPYNNDAEIQQSDGHIINTTRSYTGISKGPLASRVAQRDQKQLGSGIISGRITGKRIFDSYSPGDPFRIVSERHKLDGEVVRIAGIDRGDGRDNKIRLKILQDIYNLSTEALIDTTVSDGENQPNPPEALDPIIVMEMPYRELVNMIGSGQANSMLVTNPDAGLFEAAGSRGSGDTINAILYVNSTGTYVKKDVMSLAPGAFLDGQLEKPSTTFTVTGGIDLSLITVGMLAIIGGVEIVRIDIRSGNDFTVGRACLDTVPALHADGTAIVFFDDFSMSDFDAYDEANTINVKMLPTTPLGTLSLSGDSPHEVNFDSRGIRPLRPADCQIEGDGYGPVDGTGLSTFEATCVERNRLLVSTKDWDDALEAPEAGQTTVLEILDPTATTVVTTHSGLVAADFPFAIPVASFDGNSSGWVRFGSERGGYREWQSHMIEVLVDVVVVTMDSEIVTMDGETVTVG